MVFKIRTKTHGSSDAFLPREDRWEVRGARVQADRRSLAQSLTKTTAPNDAWGNTEVAAVVSRKVYITHTLSHGHPRTATLLLPLLLLSCCCCSSSCWWHAFAPASAMLLLLLLLTLLLLCYCSCALLFLVLSADAQMLL